MNRKKAISYLLLSGLLLAFAVSLAKATSMNITVKADHEETRTINLAVDDRVLIRFTVIGQTTNTLNFSITYPNGTVSDFGNTGDVTYNFVCSKEGECVLHFLNTDPTDDKLVTLNYEVDHYIFGMPQMLFLALVVVVVCVAAVAVFILMGKSH